MKHCIQYSILLLLFFAVPSESFGQDTTVDWASFPVECEMFFKSTPSNYSTDGVFGGIGMMYFSASKKVIKFKGIRTIEMPHIGQKPDDKYEFKSESFAITAMIPIDKLEYFFEATNTGPFARIVTGTIRFSLSKSGLSGHLEDFQMAEHGQTLRGVMNRYYLPKSEFAKTMLKKYDDVFFGGNYVALEFEN